MSSTDYEPVCSTCGNFWQDGRYCSNSFHLQSPQSYATMGRLKDENTALQSEVERLRDELAEKEKRLSEIEELTSASNIECPHCGGDVQVHDDNVHLSLCLANEKADSLREQAKEAEKLRDWIIALRYDELLMVHRTRIVDYADQLYKAKDIEKYKQP